MSKRTEQHQIINTRIRKVKEMSLPINAILKMIIELSEEDVEQIVNVGWLIKNIKDEVVANRLRDLASSERQTVAEVVMSIAKTANFRIKITTSPLRLRISDPNYSGDGDIKCKGNVEGSHTLTAIAHA